MMSNRQLTAVRSKKISPCMICPICNMLLKNATTIVECLHTFCRKCIYKKIKEEELDCCPECIVHLGCTPLDKLRKDHIMQDLRTKIFGSSSRKKSQDLETGLSDPLLSTIESKEPEVSSVPFPSRRKERSLSSIVSPPMASNQTNVIGRRRSLARKARASTLYIEELDKPESLSSPPPILSKIAQKKKPSSSVGESSKQHVRHRDAEDQPVEPLDGMTDLWKPLNSLIEAAGETKPSKSTLQGLGAKSAPSLSVQEDEAAVNKAKNKKQADNSKVHVDEGGSNHEPLVKPRKHRGRRRKRAIVPEDTNNGSQVAVNAASTTTCYRGAHPIWFSLIASDAQDGDAPLPQIPSGYLMIKNPNLPISFIQKYLVQKLDLNREAEVEITLQGHPLPPTLQLQSLIELWLQSAPSSEKIKTTVGSSANDFVMVLRYGRKA